jgi:hypothetical protein
MPWFPKKITVFITRIVKNRRAAAMDEITRAIAETVAGGWALSLDEEVLKANMV